MSKNKSKRFFHLLSLIFSAVMLDIYVGILTQLLVEELYPATVADLSYKLEPSEKGVVLKLNGYNEKIKVSFYNNLKFHSIF